MYPKRDVLLVICAIETQSVSSEWHGHAAASSGNSRQRALPNNTRLRPCCLLTHLTESIRKQGHVLKSILAQCLSTSGVTQQRRPSLSILAPDFVDPDCDIQSSRAEAILPSHWGISFNQAYGISRKGCQLSTCCFFPALPKRLEVQRPCIAAVRVVAAADEAP